MTEGYLKKILTREALSAQCDALRAKGRVIGYTSGVFDLLHPGHVDYLAKARQACDVLVVGVNSDASVRVNKGANRPICSAKDRAEVIAALACVDYVFIFDDKNNNKNIELLKPGIYIKAGDYEKSELSSAPIVEKYGGKVLIIPFKKGYSTTSTIDKIAETFGSPSALSTELPASKKWPAVFLDRDGTLVEYVDFLHEPEKLKIIPGVFEAIKKLRAGGYRIVVITNQPGIGMGYFTKEDFFGVNRAFLRHASKEGALIDKIYFCPHNQADGCDCRKPEPGMINRAVAELNLDLSKSYFVGDTTMDIEAGRRVGCKTILVKTGLGGSDKTLAVKPDMEVESLTEAAKHILENI
jgi:rfaE bifunctional protein nucleotidyltransferase chain/domain